MPAAWPAPTTTTVFNRKHRPSLRGGLGPPQNGRARREQAASRRCPLGPRRGAEEKEATVKGRGQKGHVSSGGAHARLACCWGNAGREGGLHQDPTARNSLSQTVPCTGWCCASYCQLRWQGVAESVTPAITKNISWGAPSSHPPRSPSSTLTRWPSSTWGSDKKAPTLAGKRPAQHPGCWWARGPSARPGRGAHAPRCPRAEPPQGQSFRQMFCCKAFIILYFEPASSRRLSSPEVCP